jgi:hypothetical protein
MMQLQCLRSGIWCTRCPWGRVVPYRASEGKARESRRAKQREEGNGGLRLLMYHEIAHLADLAAQDQEP